MKFFGTEIIWNTEGFPYESFRHCETKNFQYKIVIPAPSLIPNIFRYQKFSETRWVPLEIFRHDKTKNFRQKIVIAPSYAWNFSIPETFWNTEGLLYEMLRYCETKQFWRKIVIPAPSLIPNIFRYQKFSEAQKGSSTKSFGTVRQKFFDSKSQCPPPPLMHKIFIFPKISENEGFPYEIFRHCETINDRRKNRDAPPPLSLSYP